MERMDGYRRAGGWAWVAVGVAAQAVGLITGAGTPAVITRVLITVVVALSLITAISPTGRAAVAAGWVTACLLAANLLGAVLDRFGVLGAPGSAGVSWGSWQAFYADTAILLHHPGASVAAAAASAATVVEVALAALLMLGWQRRWVGKALAGLFVIYTIALAAGPQRAGVLTYAMPVLVGGALVLSATPTRRRQRPGQPPSRAPIWTDLSHA